MNVDIVQSPNLKKIKQFINADGTISEGGFEENLGRGIGERRVADANRDAERTESETEKTQ